MKRPVFSFRPNRKDRNHRKAWSILEKVPEGAKSQFMRQTVATAEPEELPDQVLDFISMLQEE